MTTKFGEIIEPLEDIPSPSLETRPDRCADDARLRNAGYVIVERPPSGQDVWVKNGVRYTAREALLRLQTLRGGLTT